MEKYTATFTVNGGSTYGTYDYTNKATARREIRNMANGNVFVGNQGQWAVTDSQNNVVSSGVVS